MDPLNKIVADIAAEMREAQDRGTVADYIPALAHVPIMTFGIAVVTAGGYAPLVNFYAEQGFVVIQPTHANSKVAGLPRDRPDAPLFCRSRVEEMKLILDQLDDIERLVPRELIELRYDDPAGLPRLVSIGALLEMNERPKVGGRK